MNTDTSITETKGLPVVVNVEGLCELLQLGRPSALQVCQQCFLLSVTELQSPCPRMFRKQSLRL